MGGQSTFVKVFLVIVVVVLLLGFYLTIDAISVLKVSREAFTTELRQMRDELAQLRKAAAEGRLAVAGKDASREAIRFANQNLRDPEAVDGGALVAVISTETRNMNTIINNDAYVANFWGMANDSLAERNYQHPARFEPKLAESWEISEDKKTYIIHLRKGVRWHDFTDPITDREFRGVEVTAADVKFYVDIIKNPKIPCDPLRVYFKDLERVEVVDDYTLKVHWKERYFLSESITLGLMPMPRHFYKFDPAAPDKGFVENHKRNRMIVGCGPWVFKRWAKGQEIVFRRNENYYGPKPYLKRRIFKLIKEPNARLQALRKGEVDMISLLPNQWNRQTADEKFKKNFRKIKYSGRFYNYIGYNLRRDLFKDRRVRVALTHLVNRQRMRDEVYAGLARVISGNFFIESPYYDHSIKPYPFDVARARQLLAEAGWRDTDGDGVLDKDGKPFEFTFSCITRPPQYLKIAEIMANDCKQAGIRININTYEWSVYLNRIEEWDFDVVSLGWGMGWESDPYQLWHSSQADLTKSSNHVGFKNAEADKIIEIARREFDVGARVKLYNRFHGILHKEQPYTFLLSPYSLTAIHNRFRNVKVYPLGLGPADTYWVPKADQKYRY